MKMRAEKNVSNSINKNYFGKFIIKTNKATEEIWHRRVCLCEKLLQ